MKCGEKLALPCALHILTRQQWAGIKVHNEKKKILRRRCLQVRHMKAPRHITIVCSLMCQPKITAHDISSLLADYQKFHFTRNTKGKRKKNPTKLPSSLLEQHLASNSAAPPLVAPTTAIRDAAAKLCAFTTGNTHTHAPNFLGRYNSFGARFRAADQIMPKPSVPSLMESLKARSNCSYES